MSDDLNKKMKHNPRDSSFDGVSVSYRLYSS